MCGHLYIIGNGFDRYHGAKSTYWDFRRYLLRQHDEIVKTFELFFGPKALRNTFDSDKDFEACFMLGRKTPVPESSWATKFLWSDFERYLSELDREKVYDFTDMRIPWIDIESEWFSYADFYAAVDYVNEIVNLCSYEMQYHFHRWINTLEYAKGHKKLMLNLDSDAVFLNFNYTLFLESHYGIPHERICYIHGHRKQPFGSLVLGHRKTDAWTEFERWKHKHKNRRRYRPYLKDRKGHYFPNDKLAYLSFFHDDTERMGNYHYATRYYAIEKIEGYLEEYYRRNIKRCEEIIPANQAFFDSFKDVRLITILGHGLDEVDMPYFEAVYNALPNPDIVKWEFSPYSDRDIEYKERFCKKFGIKDGNINRSTSMSHYR